MDYMEEATFTDLIIAQLFSMHSLSVYRNIIYERVKKRRNISKNDFSKNLYYLKNKGLVEISRKNVSISQKGRTFYNKNIIFRKRFTLPKNGHEILLIFDIPEQKRKVRNWLRNQLKDWDFKMIQKSVWKGAGPLPNEFNVHLQLLGIRDNVRTFRIQKVKK